MNQSHTLPPALTGDKTNLSEQARKEIQDLTGHKPYEFSMQALIAWVTIASTIALAIHINNIWVTLLAIAIIGTRLNILGLLVHEQAHQLGFRGKYGDSIVNILAAYPLGISVEDYSRVHLLHHKFFLTGKILIFNENQDRIGFFRCLMQTLPNYLSKI